MRTTSLLLTFALGAGLAMAACAPEDEVVEDAEGAAADPTDPTKEFWGDDRVGDKLRDGRTAIPKNYADVEKVFKIGRECARADSKEIFVVEESQQRTLDGKSANTQRPGDPAAKVFPRAVITGCNTGNIEDPNTLENSYTLLAALFTPPTPQGDPTFSFDPAEVMALDRKTGLYNFYLFHAKGVTRVFRKDGKVLERTIERATNRATAAKPPSAEEGQRCFGCHVNGAPIMNELSDPWSGWVSFRKAFPVSKLEGETDSIVKGAVRAGDLEQIMRSAMCRYVRGFNCEMFSRPPPNFKPQGFGHTVLQNKEPGGIARLVKSALCQTEVNYDSVSSELPDELFFDPLAFATGHLEKVKGTGLAPFQFPVRSAFDTNVEVFLISQGILAPSTLQAVRLVDDENDVFSKPRCDIFGEVTKAPLPTRDVEWDQRVTKAITAKLEGPNAYPWVRDPEQQGRVAFVKALLTGTREERDNARPLYSVEVEKRQAAKVRTWRSTIAQREQERKEQTSLLYGCPKGESCGPMPILTR